MHLGMTAVGLLLMWLARPLITNDAGQAAERNCLTAFNPA
jgi:hypothetical protein